MKPKYSSKTLCSLLVLVDMLACRFAQAEALAPVVNTIGVFSDALVNFAVPSRGATAVAFSARDPQINWTSSNPVFPFSSGVKSNVVKTSVNL